MLETKGTRLAAPALGAAEMAELLAAVVTHAGEVAALVELLSPSGASALLDELARFASGSLPQADASQPLRWLLPEIHREIGRRYRAARA